MIKNINDIVRQEICKNMSDREFIVYLNNLNNQKLHYVIDLIISDFYKINFYNNFISINDMNIKTVNQIKKECLECYELLILIYETMIQFKDLDLINKSLIMEKIEKQDKEEFFSYINKFYVLDKISYNFLYDLEYFKFYYMDYIKINKRMTNISNKFFLNKMIDLKTINYDKYYSFVLEFIRVYYKWNLFFNKNSDCLEKINKTSLKDLFTELDLNDKFLLSIINGYLYYSLKNTEISENEVNDFFFKNTNLNLQKKLKMISKNK